ncbi:MAG: gliding motility-associated protein GldE [Bacteroidia bacterium]
MENLSTGNFFSFLLLIRNTLVVADYLTVSVCAAAILVLIFCSALVSSSENAFFSLSKVQIEELTFGNLQKARSAAHLLQYPKKLLATILISNTLVNITIVMISGLMFDILFDFGTNRVIGFIIEITVITFTLVLFGEVIPKIYASQNNIRVAKMMAMPMHALNIVFSPFVYLLIRSTSIIDKRITRKGHTLSADELSHAIDITTEDDTTDQEKTILKSIVNFGSTNVKEIMRQRPDVAAVSSTMNFQELLQKINEWGYSRVPVFSENLDNIIGVLYIKDLLPHLDQENDFKWINLIRKPYFVPESKKIDDLLKDFQKKRVHVAIVVDEYGGTSGMATMEDILEEIFGEINDEFDEEENLNAKLDENTFVFEAKMLINDMCRFMEIEDDTFDTIRKEADTVGGLLLEISGDLPTPGEQLTYKNFAFIVESVDNRKIKKVKVIIQRMEEEK